MEISSQLAQDIVDNIKEILDQEINYIRTDGIIIASTDINRISTYHEGARIVVETGKKLVIHEDHQWAGVRKGINFPVFLNKEIIGIIGITGDKNDVMKYGKILQKMTEILIKEAYIKDIQYQQKRNQKLLVEKILNYNGDSLEQGAISNYDSSIPRILISGKFVKSPSEENINKTYNLLNMLPLNEVIDLFLITDEEILLFYQWNDGQKNILYKQLETMKECLNVQLHWGIGTIANSFPSVQISCHNARIATIWGQRVTNCEISWYDELELGSLLSELPIEKGVFYYQKIFRQSTDEQIHSMITLLEAYEQYNGSIIKCADALFIHKNTLQYQLGKIKKDTGYDPRNLHDFTILKTAILLYRLLNPDNS